MASSISLLFSDLPKPYYGYYLFTIFVGMIVVFGRPKYGLSLVWMRPQIPKPRNSQWKMKVINPQEQHLIFDLISVAVFPSK